MNEPDHGRSPSQPDPESSSDGDGSWTDDPITQDPAEDRSVEHVIARIPTQSAEHPAEPEPRAARRPV